MGLLNKFRDIDLVKAVRALLERVELLEGSFNSYNLTISGGDFSNTAHDIDLDGGVF